MTEAEAEERHLAFDDGLPDRGAFRIEPRIGVILPDIHRAAHDPQRVVGAEIRERLALVELDRGPLDAVLAQEIPEHPGVFDRDVLEDEDFRTGRGHRGSRGDGDAEAWYRVLPASAAPSRVRAGLRHRRSAFRSTPMMHSAAQVGELGWELRHPIEYSASLHESLVETGRPRGLRFK